MTANGIASGRVSLRATILWTLMLVAVLAIFSVTSRGQTTDLLNAPVNPAMRVVLRGQRAPWALPQNSQGPVPGYTMLEHLTLVLKRSPQRQKAFEQFLQDLQDPASRNYHHFLTPLQMGKRFGASEHDIDAISEWLRSQGLRVDSVANSRMMIDFSGNAAQVGAAFATEMRYYLVNGEQRMATAEDPQIPAALAGVIQSVSGLYTIKNRPYHGAGHAQKVKGMGLASPAGTFCEGSVCRNFIFPADFAAIYGLSSVSVDGTGQTIAIIGRAKVYGPDIQNFQSLSGLAVNVNTPTVIVPPDGVDPGAPAGTGGASDDQLEATLDVMRSTSIAPGATIDLIVSLSTETADGVAIAAEYAVDTDPVPAQIMNISFGGCEAEAGQSGVDFWDSLFSQAAGEGISVFVCAGDSGAAGCDRYFQTPPQTQIASPNAICSSSYSTCVGGTEFADAANPAQYWNQNPTQSPPYESALGYIPEGGWNEPLNGSGGTQAAAGGGGFSVYIATPSWQSGTGVPGTQGRYTPDIAFSSSGHDGYFGCLAADGSSCVVDDGSFSFEYFYGTSAAAPDMAGITALLNQEMGAPQGELNQRLYQLAANPANAVFHDVTVASSGVSGCTVSTPSMCNNSTPSPTGLTGGLAGYLVTAGYDEVTGLGSIDVANLLANFPPSATSTAITSSQNPQSYGGAVSFTASVTTTGTNPPTGSVTFNDGATTLGSQTLNGSQLATFTIYTLTAGTHSITAVYGGDTSNAGSRSPVLTQVITPATTVTTLTASASTIASGASVTLTVAVTPSAGLSSATGPPTGTVTFYNGANSLGTGTLSAGKASLTSTALLTIGTDSISAVYAGDANYQGSASNQLTETVSAATFTISATPASQTVSGGGAAVITITVTPQGSYTSPISFTATLTPTSSAQVGFNPTQVTPNGSTTTTVLTIQGATAGAVSGGLHGADRGLRFFPDGRKLTALNTSAFWTPIGLAGIFVLGRRKRGDWRGVLQFVLAAALALIALTMFGCSPSGPTQTYQVQITATAAASGNSGAVTTSTTAMFTAH